MQKLIINYRDPYPVIYFISHASNGISLYSHLLIFSNHNIKLNWVLNFNEDRRHRNDGSSCPDLSSQRGKRRQTARGHLLSRRGLVLGPLGWESLSISHQFCFLLNATSEFLLKLILCQPPWSFSRIMQGFLSRKSTKLCVLFEEIRHPTKTCHYK